MRKLCFLLLLNSLILNACVTPNQIDGRKSADSIAQNHGFVHKYTMGGQFVITTYEKITTPNAPYVFYIEGDGLTYTPEGNKIYTNPTPVRQTLLSLAAMDKRSNVILPWSSDSSF